MMIRHIPFLAWAIILFLIVIQVAALIWLAAHFHPLDWIADISRALHEGERS